jgi:hypothetical protein
LEELRVIGYHGTRQSLVDKILLEGFQPSTNPHDWLGNGVYFWQDAPLRAWEWADRHFGSEATVLVADILLADCMDLIDIGWFAPLRNAFYELLERKERSGERVPAQRAGPTPRPHPRDREVINHLVESRAHAGEHIRCVRAVFLEGKPTYPQSALYSLAHVQIAVRDTSLIENVRMVERAGDSR